MTSERPFYRNVITIEVLSEAPLGGEESLSYIESLIDVGACSGKVETTVENEQVDGRRMAQLLSDQESDPEFFGLDEDGNDLDDTEEEDGEPGSSERNGSDTSPDAHIPSAPAIIYDGSVEVELTGLGVMRQRRILSLETPQSQAAVEALAKATAGDHDWDYQGMQEETVEVLIVH